jgi:hypothetical protein
MPPVGFDPTIPANALPQTYALDRAATGIGPFEGSFSKFAWKTLKTESVFCRPYEGRTGTLEYVVGALTL